MSHEKKFVGQFNIQEGASVGGRFLQINLDCGDATPFEQWYDMTIEVEETPTAGKLTVGGMITLQGGQGNAKYYPAHNHGYITVDFSSLAKGTPPQGQCFNFYGQTTMGTLGINSTLDKSVIINLYASKRTIRD